MASQSLYRKWRSQTFDDIIGQPHVVRTLQNAVTNDLVAHAYLLTGPRGTGKTSTARILAKAVNCINRDGPIPCGTCTICVSIRQGSCPDVIEIDGASNTGIDDIRALRERIAFTPTEARFKIYIIDEVHRLSANAFDGLLKTLEEPPAHVVFIFASTEPQKVPLTILSRCQRFDFHKIGRNDIVGRLAEISSQEGIKITSDAIQLIAQQSGGSLRDAIGLLDQINVFTGGEIGVGEVRESIGLGTPDTVASLCGHMLDGDPGAALRLIHEAVEGGVDPRLLSRQLVEYWRWLLLVVSGAGDEVDVDPALSGPLMIHGGRVKPSDVIAVLRCLTEQVIEPRLSVPPALPLEMAVVQGILALDGSSGKSAPPPVNEPVVKGKAEAPPKPAEDGGAGGPTLDESQPAVSVTPPAPATKAQVPAPSVPTEEEVATQEVPLEAPENAKTEPSTAWPEIKVAVRGRSQRLHALLRDATPTSWTESHVEVVWPYRFHRDEMDRPENRLVLEEAIASVTGHKLKVLCRQASKEEIKALQDPDGTATDDDGFVEEVERMLKGVHARLLKNSRP